MLIKRCLITLWLLLMLAIIASRCFSQYWHVHAMASYAKQANPFYKKLTELGTSPDTSYDPNNNLSQEIAADNQSINNIYNTTKTLHDTVYTAIPTNLSANLLVVHNTFLHKYAIQLDNDFQVLLADTLDEIKHLETPSNTQENPPPQ